MHESINDVENLVRRHERWRAQCINLIAAENYSSDPARRLQNSDLIHRYAYWENENIHTRYYQGNKYIEELEELTIELAKELFHAEWVDIRPVSGMTAIVSVILNLTQSNDLVMEPGRVIGGHNTMAKLTMFKGPTQDVPVALRYSNYPPDIDHYNIDVDATIETLQKIKPTLLLLGASIFIFPHPVREISKAAKDIGAHVVYDASHVLGLIAGGQFQDPLQEGVDLVSASTHKTFAGPQGGIIFAQDAELGKQIKLRPLIDSHHPHKIPGLFAALAEYKTFGPEYASQIVQNAKALGSALRNEGLNVLYYNLDFTESHAILVDVSEYGNGVKIAKQLEQSNIICNKMQTPQDMLESKPIPSGIRLGVQEMTRFGMKEKEMHQIAEFMRRLLIDEEDPRKVQGEVQHFRTNFQQLYYCFP